MKEAIRREAERSDSNINFVLTHSINGGTGSGLAYDLLREMSDSSPKGQRCSMSVFPSPNISSLMVEPYNSVMASSELVEYCTMIIPVTNEKIYDVSDKKFSADVSFESYHLINELIVRVLSTLTCSMRFPTQQVTGSFRDIPINLIPFRKLNTLIPSFSFSKKKLWSVESSTMDCFDRGNWLSSVNPMGGKHIGCGMFYRGP